MYFYIDIEVRPEVKKFIAYRWPVSPLRLTKLNRYGVFLSFCIVRMNKVTMKTVFDMDRSVYSDTIKLQISERDFSQKGFFIHPKKKIDFNNYVLDCIEDSFLEYVEDRHGAGKKLYQYMYDFRDKYRFTEDELSFKSMSKKYERHRKRAKSLESA